jgi:hypothetical protein
VRRLRKLLALLAAVLAVSFIAYLAHSHRTRSAPSTPSPAAGQPAVTTAADSPAAAGGSGSPSSSPTVTEPPATQGEGVNVAAPEIGGHIELASSEYDRENRAAIHLIDRGRPEADYTAWVAATGAPQEIVIGFFERQPARIAAIVVNPNPHSSASWAKDIEAWTSMESPTSGFVKIASLTIVQEDREQTMTFAPVEARFVKLRIVSQQTSDREVGIGKIRVIEAQAPGYTPLLARNPRLAALVADRPAGAGGTPGQGSTPPPAAMETVSANVCGSAQPVPQPAVHRSSSKVLVLARTDKVYPPIGYSAKDAGENPETSIYGRIAFTRVPPGAVSPTLLDPAEGFDTVVLAQVCDIKTSVPDSFKRALVDWVGQGHKLIIQDSDLCDGDNTPDYSFLPYHFSTSNPGRKGAESKKLIFVEENGIANSKPGDPAALDVDAWASKANELGDSNTVKDSDPHWCGHLATRNVLNVNGFVETYAHYGRGLIVYDGFDYDQAGNAPYHRLVTRELAAPFDPDGLACSARLSDFVLTTEAALRTQDMAPGRTYKYPVTLLSNQGYKGTVHLTASVVPPDPSVTVTLDRATTDLVDAADVQLMVTTSGGAGPSERTIAVQGTDEAGRSNVLCLRLGERTSGSLRVATEFPHPAHTSKNLEIILDLSGSMKLPLGKSTRIATARRVLREVVAKIPDDFNVGLRVYGHRYGSRQPETCTDSELVVPIQRLDRTRLMGVVDSTQPRGETPLVYSVLQTAADLKALGGGSVILITDGEESCHGDPAAAARELKASGVDVSLQILGFTLTGQQVEQQLTQFAQATGGRYYAAQNGEALGRALLMAAVDKMPFTVFDGTGRQVATGDTGSAAIDLAPGEYKVVVRAADQDLTAEHVTIPARGDAVLKVVVKDNRFELQR